MANKRQWFLTPFMAVIGWVTTISQLFAKLLWPRDRPLTYDENEAAKNGDAAGIASQAHVPPTGPKSTSDTFGLRQMMDNLFSFGARRSTRNAHNRYSAKDLRDLLTFPCYVDVVPSGRAKALVRRRMVGIDPLTGLALFDDGFGGHPFDRPIADIRRIFARRD